MFKPGDVVRCYSPTAGKTKFHICLIVSTEGDKFSFLFVNSKTGFKGDCILDDGDIPGLPRSEAGISVVSFSMVPRFTDESLKLFDASKVGAIDARVAGELLGFARETKALADIDKVRVVKALEDLLCDLS